MSTIGVVLECPGFNTGLAAIKPDVAIAPGAFVRLVCADRDDTIAAVRGVRTGGGVFTEKTAGYLLMHLNDLATRRSATHLLLDLAFVGTLRDGAIHRRLQPMIAGSRVTPVSAADVARYLDLPQAGGIRLGDHSGHPGVEVRVLAEDLRGAHAAILGQTGSGKTNLLRLLHNGLTESSQGNPYVLFDFHDEFRPTHSQDTILSPPFSFGSSDMCLEVLTELLPGLSIPQQDALSVALDRSPDAMVSLIDAIDASPGSESTKRVLSRRLQRLDRSGAFCGSKDIGSRVATIAGQVGRGTIVQVGSVQSELARVFIARTVRRLMVERMRGHIPPITLVVDEAHRLMARAESSSATRAFRFVAQEGRKFGITMILATQRPGLVDSTILSQCGTVVGLRLISPEDTRVVARVMHDVRAEEFTGLNVGQGILSCAWRREPLWVDFDLFRSEAEPAETVTLRQQLFDL